MTVKQRTLAQNRALHLYCTHLAAVLNESGLEMRKVLKPGIEIPWTPKAVKEFLWRPIMKASVRKESTTQLDKNEVSEVWEILNRHLGEKFGVHVEFPSLDSLYEK